MLIKNYQELHELKVVKTHKIQNIKVEHNHLDIQSNNSYFSVLHMFLNIREIRVLISLDDEISRNLIFFKRVPKKNTIAIRL